MQFTVADFAAIAPQVAVIVSALLVLLLDAFFPRLGRAWLANFTLIGLAIAALAVWENWPTLDAQPALQGMVAPDRFSAFFNVVFLVGGAISVLLSVQYANEERIAQGEYYALMLFCISGMMVLASSINLITIFLGIEILSIALYVLAGYERERRGPQEAALKYFFLGAFASAFLLYGIALTYGATRSLDIGQIVAMLPTLPNPRANFLLLSGVAMMLVGFAFKIAAVPFHVWAPDVYEGAPTPITAFMSVGAKAAGFAAMARVLIGAFQTPFPGYDQGLAWIISSVLASVAALTMLLGNVVAVVQPNIKRMLAYSSIAHAGYMLLGIVATLRAPSSQGVAAVIFYALAYTFTNLGAFSVILAFRRRGEEVLEIRDLAGLGNRYPALGMLMTLFMLSLAGFPLTAGFVAKFYIFMAFLHPDMSHLLWLAILGVMTSVVSFFYYLGVVRSMFMDPAHEGDDQPVARRDAYLDLALAVTAVGVIVLGILPAGVLDAATQAASTLGSFVDQAAALR